MTHYFFINFDTKSNDLYKNISRIPYPAKVGKKFLTKKRCRDEEFFLTHLEKDFYKSKTEEVNEAFKSIFPMFPQNNILEEEEISFEDDERYFIKKIKEEKSLLKAFYPDYYLFTKAKEDLLKDYLKGIDFSIITRSEERLPNFLQKYYIRVNIKRTFMNTYLLTGLNQLLKDAGFITYFEKFPQSFASNVTIDKCKILMNMRLKEIFRVKELYKKISKKNYEHNLKIVDEIEKRGNPELNIILNRKFYCLFEEYINSEEFGKVELNRLRTEKKKDEYYLKKYVYLAKQFIEFCMTNRE